MFAFACDLHYLGVRPLRHRESLIRFVYRGPHRCRCSGWPTLCCCGSAPLGRCWGLARVELRRQPWVERHWTCRVDLATLLAGERVGFGGRVVSGMEAPRDRLLFPFRRRRVLSLLSSSRCALRSSSWFRSLGNGRNSRRASPAAGAS